MCEARRRERKKADEMGKSVEGARYLYGTRDRRVDCDVCLGVQVQVWVRVQVQVQAQVQARGAKLLRPEVQAK